MNPENTLKGNSNINQQDSNYQDRSSGQQTKIYTGPERRRPENDQPQQSQFSYELRCLATNLRSTNKHLTVTAIIAAVLLIIQVIGITLIFFVLNQLHDAPNNIINEINAIVEGEQTKHQLYVERIVKDFEDRQTTREIAKGMESMRNEMMEAIRKEHKNIEE